MNRMRRAWIASDNIISPLGITTRANYESLRLGHTGIELTDFAGIKGNIALGRIRAFEKDQRLTSLTRFEQLAVQSAESTIKSTSLDPCSPRTIFILSTTKGNIELLEQDQDNSRIHLHSSAKAIAKFFGNPNKPLVISSACISGVMALLTGKHLLEMERYDHAVVIGADVLSFFVISGFQSLQALSAEVCRPFDKHRKGINLGEAASSLLLSTDPESIGVNSNVFIAGGGLTNDANHISGPSRTGEELCMAITTALHESRITPDKIDFISAHGTATVYNDEMEAKAFHLAQLQQTPIASLKGYFGHTLGAAGILETVISLQSMYANELITSYGFDESGVSKPLNIIRKSESKKLTTCLKTASGFGGCNAAMILTKQ